MPAKPKSTSQRAGPPRAAGGERRRVGSILTEHDIYLFKEGSHVRLYEKLGAHPAEIDGKSATRFAVWAPGAAAVAVIGDFNGWDPGRNPLQVRQDGSGIWEGVVPGVAQGAYYKYRIRSHAHGHEADKGDPFAFYWQLPPATASRVWNLEYEWGDHEWMTRRAAAAARNAPMSIYEVHIGSWRRVPEEDNRPLTYRELAEPLAAYVRHMGFTHVELMPVMEHPFYGSWGYQTTGYFAPTARYGTPQDFMYLVDYLHGQGIGVILDWVPSHFPNDGFALVYFDGTHLFEHADPRQGYHPEWNSCIFNYGRHEVRAFLESSALFWLDKYHIDGLRVDAVASMLYLDYARKEGEWIPNEYGGRENLAAMSFLRHMNEAVYRDFPDVQTIAEESTAWPMVSRPVSGGGLGFGYKWNMGWMHDTLKYLSRDPIYRTHHHDQLTFSIWYAFDENFVLALSHDEVVHGKGSLIGKMPGDEWQQFANLRLLFGYMWAHPGKKLLFMGGEFGQRREWQHEESLEWHVLGYPLHEGVREWVADLNRCYRAESALADFDCERGGFEWIEANDRDNSVLSFIRRNARGDEVVLVVLNYTPIVRSGYVLGVPRGGRWQEILNSDAERYGGSGVGNLGGVEAQPHAAHDRDWSLRLTLPPLSALFFKSTGRP
ncbi:MAG: 1,4-alpha-glucan branching protein GlgB [Betaproteobacteria bacterium]|nr:MAG: 1,4-alpha-glucan branching protein GlgB [Betaproteobacteria bacterium]